MALYARFAKLFASILTCTISGSGWRETRRATSVRSTWSRPCWNSKECSTSRVRFVDDDGASSVCATCSIVIRASLRTIPISTRAGARDRGGSRGNRTGRYGRRSAASVQDHDEYERCQRLLVHDLGELSYMIEQHCQDPALLQRCDELVTITPKRCVARPRTAEQLHQGDNSAEVSTVANVLAMLGSHSTCWL